MSDLLTIKALRALVSGSIEPDPATIQRILIVLSGVIDRLEKAEEANGLLEQTIRDLVNCGAINP